MRDHTRAAWGAGLVLSAAVGGMIAAGLHGRSILDPAVVSLRYGQNLAAGNGLVFNLGERVEGFSDPLWTLLLSLLMALGAPPIGTATVLGVVGLGLTIVLVGWIGTRTLGEGPGALAALMVAAWPPMWVAARSLDDVTTVGALILWSLGLILSERDGKGKCRWTGLALVLTALTGLLGAGCALVLAGLAGRRRLGLVVLTLLVLSVARWAYFGSVIPAFIWAMPWGGSGRWAEGGGWLLQLCEESPVLSGLGLLGAAWALVRRKEWRGAGVVVGVCTLLAVGGSPARVHLWHPLVPVVGVLALLGVGLIASMSRQPVLSRVLLVLVLAGFSAQDFRVAHARSEKVSQARQGRFVQARALARFLAQRFPDGEAIAAHKIGVIGHFMPNPIIDLSGRVDAEISRAPRQDLLEPGQPVRSDISSAVARKPAAFVHPRSMVGKRQGRIRVPPWYPSDFDKSYATVALSSRRHWELTDGEQIWLFFFIQSGLPPVPDWMKKP